MNTDRIIELLSKEKMTWKHVEGLVCVHTFYKDWFINLCAYSNKGVPVMYLNVDNINKNISDVIDKEFVENTTEYDLLSKIYKEAFAKGETISTGSAA